MTTAGRARLVGRSRRVGTRWAVLAAVLTAAACGAEAPAPGVALGALGPEIPVAAVSSVTDLDVWAGARGTAVAWRVASGDVFVATAIGAEPFSAPARVPAVHASGDLRVMLAEHETARRWPWSTPLPAVYVAVGDAAWTSSGGRSFGSSTWRPASGWRREATGQPSRVVLLPTSSMSALGPRVLAGPDQDASVLWTGQDTTFSLMALWQLGGSPTLHVLRYPLLLAEPLDAPGFGIPWQIASGVVPGAPAAASGAPYGAVVAYVRAGGEQPSLTVRAVGYDQVCGLVSDPAGVRAGSDLDFIVRGTSGLFYEREKAGGGHRH